MRKLFSRSFVVAALLALAACGGSGEGSEFETPGPNTPPPGGGTAVVSSVTLSSTAASIPADNSSSAEISALVRDANNVAMAGVAVQFSSTAGSLVVSQATTDSSGIAKATLSATGAAAGSAITVTAVGGTVTQTMVINVANTQQSVTVVTSAPQIPSDGTSPATITALVRGANNQLLADVPVTFSATSGGLAVTRAITDQNGSAVAVLSSVGDPTNRRITVTAASGSTNATVPVDVVGTKLTVTGSASMVQGTSATYDIALVDSANNGIPGRTINVTSALTNPLTPGGSVTTDATGRAALTVTATNSGAETLTATALGLTAQRAVTISNQNFRLSTTPTAVTTVAIGTTQGILLTWTANGNPQANQQVTFSTTRGLFTGNVVATQATTDGAGQAVVNISSATSGPAVITASAAGVTTQFTLNFIATVPATISVQASPSTIPTEGQTTISAVVRDASSNLVQGQTVTFQLTDITGGTLSLASAITDSQGRAQTVYTASQTPSSSNGVTIQASVLNTGITSSTTFTVGGQTVLLSFGTGATISENAQKTQFILPYTVTALDAAGNAVNGVTITMSVRSEEYAKGGYMIKGGDWVQTGTPDVVPPALTPVENPITVCPNEDDGDAILEAGEDTSGLGNGNGRLDPGGVAATSVGTVVTANGGTAHINVIYPEDHALWVRVTLTAKATVQGTESLASSSFWLPILASYLTNTNSTPPGFVSPYGKATSCTDEN
jgi:hypothetical protein